MTVAQTPEERLRQADRMVGEVKQDFVELVEQGFEKAVVELRNSDHVGQAFWDRLREVDDRLRDLPRQLDPSLFEVEQLHELHTSLHEIRDLMRELDEGTGKRRLDVLNELLIRIEVVGQVIRDALDEHVQGLSSDVGAVLRTLGEWLPGTTQDELGRLAGVSRRTISRWARQSTPPPRRLRLVAQLIAILRHSWTEKGVIAWFDRANRELDGRKPISVLDDPDYEQALLAAARGTRSQYGT